MTQPRRNPAFTKIRIALFGAFALVLQLERSVAQDADPFPIELLANSATGIREAGVDLGTVITGAKGVYQFALAGHFDPSLEYQLKPDCGCTEAKIISVAPNLLKLSLVLRAGSQEELQVVRSVAILHGSEMVARLRMTYQQLNGISVTPNQIIMKESVRKIVIAVESRISDAVINSQDVKFEGDWIRSVEPLSDGKYELSFELPSTKFPLVCHCVCRCIAKSADGENHHVFSDFLIHRPGPFRCLNSQLKFSESEGKWTARAWLSGLPDSIETDKGLFVLHVSAKDCNDVVKKETSYEMQKTRNGTGSILIELPDSVSEETEGTLILRVGDLSIDVLFTKNVF